MAWKHCTACGMVTKHGRAGCTHEDHGRAPESGTVVMPDLFGRPPAPPTNGTRTSAEAAASLSDLALSDGHRKVLNALYRRKDGLTDEAIQEATGLNPSSERPRRGELVEDGLVEDSGQTRNTASGRKAVVWRLTALAYELARKRPASEAA